MNKFGSLYVEGNSFFHRANPSIKLIMFILWVIAVFMFLDLRISICLLLLGFVLLQFADIPYKISRNLFVTISIFNLINAVFILLIAPDYGVTLSGNHQILYTIAGFNIYTTTLWYILVISLKYLSLLPLTIIFIFTTHPSKFAASLNQLMVPYKLAYIISIIFRYFPDIHQEFKTIANAGAARGFSIAKDEKSLFRRARNLFSITIPLINQAMLRIDKVSNAMDLRRFGYKWKRTWYNRASFSFADLCLLVVSIVIFSSLVYMKTHQLSNFNYLLFQ